MRRGQPDVRWERAAVLAIIAGAALRAAWIFVAHPPSEHVYSDMEGYVSRARDLAALTGLDRYDAFYPPGTHLLLAIPFAFAGDGRSGLWLAQYLWWILASLIPFLTWRLARVLLSARAAALAAMLVAFYPLHISYSGYFLSEIPATAFLLGSLWMAYSSLDQRSPASPRGLFLAGLSGAMAVITRPQFVFNLALIGLPLLRRPDRRMRLSAVLLAGAAIPIGLALTHNAVAAGRIVGLNENGGITFYVGHCQVSRVTLGAPGYFYISPPPQLQKGGRVKHFPDARPWDQSFFYERGLECIRDDGLAHLGLVAQSIVDMGATTAPWPQAEETGAHRWWADLANALYTVGLLAVVIFAAMLARRPGRGKRSLGELTLLAHLAMLVPLAVLVFGDPRFRTPYDVFGLALAGAVLDRWLPGETSRTAASAGMRPDLVRSDDGRSSAGSLDDALGVRDVEPDEGRAARR